MTMAASRTVRSPRGTQLRCKGWQQEAALRCLMNNLDPEVAERPADLVVYGGRGKAARNWPAFEAIVHSLEELEGDETLLIQSGKPVGLFTTHPLAPRVLMANSLLVPDWATWEEFWRLEGMGLTAYGQMTAGSWIYIGTQGILQGTFQTFAAVADQRFGGSLRGHIVLTAGLGGMGGAQPLAITMNQGVALCVEVDPARVERRLGDGYLMERADGLEDALTRCEAAAADGRPLSVAVIANAADALPALLERAAPVTVATDQTSAHDPLYGYIPSGLSIAEAAALRARDPDEYVQRARASMARHCEALVGFQRQGAEVFDYGNNLRGEAKAGGFTGAFSYPGFVPAYLRPLFCEGKGPFRWVALSGDPADIAATDRVLLAAFPDDPLLQRWLPLAAERVPFPGPAGAHLLAGLRRAGSRRRLVQRPRAPGPCARAHRHRPRPSRRRIRRLPLSRDRGDGRRFRRRRRLADPQRLAQHGVGGHMGRCAPRRRGRHGQVHPRRRAARGRWHR